KEPFKHTKQMHKVKQLLVIIVLAGGIMTSCENNSYKTTESGIKYKYIEEGEGEIPEAGQVMIMNMVGKDSKDTVLISSLKQGEPMPMPVDSTWTNDGSIYEIFKLLKTGDSVEIQITAEGFYTKTF